MKNNIHDVIASITAILIHNGLSELSLGDTDELTEPTNVVWYDKDGNPYDDRVTGVFWDGEELSLEVEAGEFYQRERIYSYDFAFSNIDGCEASATTCSKCSSATVGAAVRPAAGYSKDGRNSARRSAGNSWPRNLRPAT